MTNASVERGAFLPRSWPIFFILTLLFATLIPSWNIGFVCEDYCHLVEESARLPLVSSFDGLHRPLRNIVLKIAYEIFGLNSAPYHLAIILLHLAVVVVLYRFVLRLGGSRLAALVAATLFGFFPRNHQAVFWVSVGVDSVVAIGALTACSTFLDYLEEGRIRSYFAALFSFVCALGFKETAIAIIPLLLLVQVTTAKELFGFSFRRAFLSLMPFGIVGAVFVLWTAGFFGRARVPQEFYAVQNASQTIKMALKFVLNIALPFSRPLEVREVFQNLPLLGGLIFILAGVAFAATAVVTRKRLLLSTGWVLLAMGPTAVFGFYNDRYLSLPFIGAAILLGFVAEGLVNRARHSVLAQAGLVLALCAYVAGGIARLTHYEHSWAAAGREIRDTMEETRKIYPLVPPGSVFTFVNLTHSRETGQIYIFNVGLNGTLWASGYDTSVTGRRIFASADPREQRLVRTLVNCERQAKPSSRQLTLVVSGDVKDVSGRCAQQTIETSQEQAAELWK